MIGGIGQNKLNRRSCIAMQLVVNAIDALCRVGKFLRWDSGGNGAVAKKKLLCVAGKGAQIIMDGLVAAMDSGIERRVVNVNPEGFVSSVDGVHLCVLGYAESIGIPLGRKISIKRVGNGDAEIAIGLGHCWRATGKKAQWQK